MKVSVKIRDAKTCKPGIPDKGRWVDGEVISGQIGEPTGTFSESGKEIWTDTNVLVEYNRAYYIDDKIVEKLNRETFLYRNQVKKVI